MSLQVIDKDKNEEKKTKNDDAESSQNMTQLIADHYNSIKCDLSQRSESQIFYMKNFNNWIKSMILDEVMGLIKLNPNFSSYIKVIDLGAGKGGDLKKYKAHFIHELICVDIAQDSLLECERRYRNMKSCSKNLYKMKCIKADVTHEFLLSKMADPSQKCSLVCSQFSFHYCFESLKQAECMLENVSKCLEVGGYFVGTTPDAYDIVSRLRKADGLSFGNDIYQITFPENFDKNNIPLFGAKYNFFLQGAVNCPEFLVYFPMLEKLALKNKLRLVSKARFDDYFKMNGNKSNGKELLEKLSALETYSPINKHVLRGNETDYKLAEEFVDKMNKRGVKVFNIGTLSLSEWEAISLYTVFIFIKER